MDALLLKAVGWAAGGRERPRVPSDVTDGISRTTAKKQNTIENWNKRVIQHVNIIYCSLQNFMDCEQSNDTKFVSCKLYIDWRTFLSSYNRSNHRLGIWLQTVAVIEHSFVPIKF